MTSKNRRIAEIEEMQERIRERAEEARKAGEYVLFALLKQVAELLEGDKLLVSPPKLLSAYRDILRKTAIEIGGMSWPVSSIINVTSDAKTM